MIPRTLDEWTLDRIRNLLGQGYFEPEHFDFKEMLPHPKDKSDNAKGRLRKTCCAFANTAGGFLVFGVKDDKTLTPENRLVGISPAIDFPVEFGNYPAECKPSIKWEFKNPPINLSTGNRIHIIWLPHDWTGPHAISDGQGGWIFPKRTNKGNEEMNYDEVRLSFLGQYEKRLKLQLLLAELETIRRLAAESVVSKEDRMFAVAATAFDLTVVESVLCDTYSILTDSHELLRALSELRVQLRVVNTRVGLILPAMYSSLPTRDSLVRQHNDFMAFACERTISWADDAISRLKELLEPSVDSLSFSFVASR